MGAVPDVVIGGAPRSGTTFLCEVLSKHPGTYVLQPFIPEPKVLLAEGQADRAYLDWYASLFAGAPDGAVRIEKTSNYLENEAARQRFARLLPETRALFILRDPIERAYSNWRWSTHNGLETLPFAEALASEGKRANPFNGERPHVRPFDYFGRSRYGSLTKAWIDSIGRDRLSLFILEDAVAEPERFVDLLQRSIGLAPLPWGALRTGVINAVMTSDRPSNDVIEELRQRLAPEMALLQQQTGIDVARWGY